MKKIENILLKLLKWLGIFIAFILFLMFIIPLLFPGTISEQVKIFANKKLAGKLDYKAVHLTFFRHFPSLTVSVDDLLLQGSQPLSAGYLVSSKRSGSGHQFEGPDFWW